MDAQGSGSELLVEAERAFEHGDYAGSRAYLAAASRSAEALQLGVAQQRLVADPLLIGIYLLAGLVFVAIVGFYAL